MPLPSLSQLHRALQIQEQIQTLEAELQSIMAGGESTRISGRKIGKLVPAEPKAKGKRTMSAASRARIATAQRARWAKSKGEKGATTTEIKPLAPAAKPRRKKRTMSPEARARIVAAQKKRWAKFRKVN
jgi:hypothetical protein